MLWPHLPTSFFERTCVRGTHADRKLAYSIPWFSENLKVSLQANKLTTVKKCLNEVLKYGGPFNARDLYPVMPFL